MGEAPKASHARVSVRRDIHAFFNIALGFIYRMPRYISLHALGCLPKPAFVALCKKTFADQGARVLRICAGQIAGKMLVEFEAESQEVALGWLTSGKLTPLWLMRVDYQSQDGSVEDL